MMLSCLSTTTSLLLFVALLDHSIVCHAFAAKAGRSPAAKGFGSASKTAKTYQPDTSAQVQPFLDFVNQQKGAKIQHIEIGIDKQTGRRGLYTTKTFGKDDALICKVPSDCALALADPEALLQENDDDDDALPSSSIPERGLSFLQRYANKDDWFTPYLNILPSEITSSTPNLWSDDEIDLLEFPRLVKQAKERRIEIQQLAEANGIAISDLEYATWLVSSRAFPIRIAQDGAATNEEYDERGQVLTKAGEGKFIPVLVPILDMANHGVKPNAKLTLIDPEKDDAFFALTTTRPVKAGQEITLAYGSGVDSSVELLLNYGFVCSGNPIDKFMLKKGGDDCITSLDGWTTTLEEDRNVLNMLGEDDSDNETLKKILAFRIQLKESYPTEDE